MRPASMHRIGRKPFAAGEDAVPHRLMDRDRMLRCRRQQSLQRGIGQRLSLLQSLVEHAGEYNKWRVRTLCPAHWKLI